MAQQPKIFNATVECRESFRIALNVARLRKDEWAQERFADFHLWAGGAGAVGRGKASLDSRLSDHPDARDVIANLLQMLRILMGKCVELATRADPTSFDSSTKSPAPDESRETILHEQDGKVKSQPKPSRANPTSLNDTTKAAELDESTKIFFLHEQNEKLKSQPKLSLDEKKAMDDVELILNQITKVTTAIRKAGSKSRRHKADSSLNLTQLSPSMESFRKHLELVVLARSSSEWSPLAHYPDKKLVFLHCSPDGTKIPYSWNAGLTEIQIRLVNANLRRRNRFLYAQTHDPKLANPGREKPQEPKAKGKQSANVPTIKASNSVYVDNSVTAEVPGPIDDTINSTTTASVLEEPLHITESQAGKTSMTGVTSTTTHITYPKAPKILGNRRTFKCPCCCQTLPAESALGNKWKKHLVADLLPYTCILEDCPYETQLYLTRQSWLDHMNKDHASSRHWICFACKQSPQPTFDQQNQFTSHVLDNHQPGIKTNQVSVLVSAWSRPVPLNIKECPFCSFAAENRAHLLDHIAREIHAFSLKSLPWGPRSLDNRGGVYSLSDDSDDDGGNHVNHFRDNQYFGDGSEHTNSQNTANSSSRSQDGDTGLPPLDFRETDTAVLTSTAQTNTDLTEDTLKGFQKVIGFPGESERKAVLDNWLSETSIVQDNTGFSINAAETTFPTLNMYPSLLKSQLTASLVRSVAPSRQRDFFLPISSLHELITVSAINEEIDGRNSHLYRAENHGSLATSIHDNARKLYAILMLCDMGFHIGGLLQDGVTDRDLPFFSTESEDHRSMLICSRDGEPIDELNRGNYIQFENFYTCQKRVLAPVFEDREHLDLEKGTILPFIDFEYRPHPIAVGGANGQVDPVCIHPAHHNFLETMKLRTELILTNGMVVAIKKLYPGAAEAFFRERQILLTLRALGDPHIVELLGTYTLDGKHHLMFPCANSNLLHYWQSTSPEPFDNTFSWVLKQMVGIANALSEIHGDRLHSGLDDEEVYGRHGSIDAHNILWFENQDYSADNFGTLQLCGFGRSKLSGGPAVGPESISSTPTYEPPEFRMQLPISSASDMWNLGCLYLDFITWLLMGRDAIVEFSNYRSGFLIETSINDDCFYMITTDYLGPAQFSVKDKVLEWVEQLYTHERCSPMIVTLLSLIVEKVLRVESGHRITASALCRELRSIQQLSTTLEQTKQAEPGLEDEAQLPTRDNHSPSAVSSSYGSDSSTGAVYGDQEYDSADGFSKSKTSLPRGEVGDRPYGTGPTAGPFRIDDRYLEMPDIGPNIVRDPPLEPATPGRRKGFFDKFKNK